MLEHLCGFFLYTPSHADAPSSISQRMRVQYLLFLVEETFNPALWLLLNNTSYALTEFSTNFLWYYTQLGEMQTPQTSSR